MAYKRIQLISKGWRRERDSNPRAPFGANGFQDRRFQPLTHPSASDLAIPEGNTKGDTVTRLPYFPHPPPSVFNPLHMSSVISPQLPVKAVPSLGGGLELMTYS